MNKILAKMAVVAAGAALAGAAVVPAIADASGAKTPVISTCAGKDHSKPHSLTLFCGDGNDTLTNMHWKDWGKASATTSAKEHINLCSPNCAAGKVHTYAVKVSATDLRAKGSVSKYGRLTVKFLGKKPAGIKRTEHFKLTAHGPSVL